MRLTQNMEQYLREHMEEMVQLIRDMCAIPAPSNHEELRADFCKKWFEENGFTNVEIDEALNVVCPVGVTEDNDLVVFMAHTDTVFPDLEPMPLKEEDGKIYCPAVCDDTANLAVLMLVARYFIQCGMQPKVGMLFVANSGEEGLGNLKGSRAICDRYGDRMLELVTLDGVALNHLVNEAVGSHRYRVTIRTEGGHSFGRFGNRNAIRCMASLIDSLYSVKVPEENGSKTTYNVGTISGGTSVNTIAQECQMLYEYRSDNKNCLAAMQKMFTAMVEAYRATGIEVEVEMLGERPCAGEMDPERWNTLMNRAAGSVREVLGLEPQFRSGSTDCNIPLSRGIPAVCMGVCVGAGCHTRGEWLEVSSLYDGGRLFMDFLADYFHM